MRPTRAFASDLLGPEGVSQFSWSPAGDLVAVAAQRKKKVVLFDKCGEVAASLIVPDPEFLYDESNETPVLALSWHPAGEHLAVLPRGQPFAMVWSTSGKLARVDSGVKPAEVTCLAWNPAGPQLALGTVKGSGVIYDVNSRAVTPLQLGRSGKPVGSMVWSAAAVPGGLLALGCKGGLLFLCRAADGTLVRSIQTKAAISQLQFCEPQAVGGEQARLATATPGGCTLLAANVGRRTVSIWQLPQALSTEGGGCFELAFRDGYGDLEQYTWLSRQLLVAGFSAGHLVVVALGGGLLPGAGSGTEIFSARPLHSAVAGLSWCPATRMLAAAAGSQLVALNCGPHDAPAIAQEGGLLELDAGQRVASIQCSPCGRLLTVATASGKLLQLLARPALLHGTCGSQLAYVDPASSPTQALLVEAASLAPDQQQRSVVALPLPVEPDLLALGHTHLAAAQGNKVWLQATQPDPATGLLPPPAEAEFPVEVTWLRLNRACLLLVADGGRVFVRLGGADDGSGEVVELRGEDGEPFAASCAALSDRSILLGLPDGSLVTYRCSDAALAGEFQHGCGGITAVFANPDGSMVLFQDATGGAFLYQPAQNLLMPLPDFSGQLQAAVWDCSDSRLVVAVSDAGLAHVYLHIPYSVQGPGVKLVGSEPAIKDGVPLVLLDGALSWHLPDGSLDTQLLSTHQHQTDSAVASRGRGNTPPQQPQSLWGPIAGASPPPPVMSRQERLAARCHEALALCHFEAALNAAQTLGDPELLKEVALAALQFLEVGVAVAAYEAAGDEEALGQLRPLLEVTDDKLLTGQLIAITGGDAERAEELLLDSSRPAAAIDMRRQLGHWERALQLAEQLEPHAVGSLALLQAQGLEAEGQVEAALGMYQQAQAAPDVVTGGAAGAAQRLADCKAGVARCSILLGDVEQGMELAVASGSADLLVQCAELLEREQHAKEAGQLYARAGRNERAARLFLSCREFGLLDGVMEHAGSPEMWHKYAQAKEDLGSFSDAARAYEKAGEVMASVRVHLDRLDDAESAAEVAQRAHSAEASLVVARFCERAGRLEMAMEHYCQGGNCPAAFLLAQRNGCMAAFADWARRNRSAEAAQLAATHYEVEKQLAPAAELSALAGKHEHAARLYLQAGGDENIAAAVKLASEGKDPAVVALVLQHLQASDGAGPALLDLHLALGNTEQACAAAVARAQQEQAKGNYKAARDQLLQVCLALQQRGAPASAALLSALHLLHSYLLVRQLVRTGDHLGAARLLLRVADSIHAFPKHIVPILTSTVIECHRAALHGPAQRWAQVLMDQHAGQVSAAYAKKIEAIAKQPAWTAEQQVEEPLGDCLFCGAAGPETSLTCAACSRSLPFCAASGKRMLLGDWSECPSCHFPCRGRDMTRTASVEKCCPLCEAAVEVHDVRRIFDPIAHCRRTVFAILLAGSQKRG